MARCCRRHLHHVERSGGAVLAATQHKQIRLAPNLHSTVDAAVLDPVAAVDGLRQAGAAIEGVEQYNRTEDRLKPSLLAVDSHGQTSVAMAVSKLLGFDRCPRLRDLAERKLFLPRPFTIPEELEAVTDRRVSLRAIDARQAALPGEFASSRQV